MSVARVWLVLVAGISLAAAGCGGSATADPLTIVNDFREDENGFKQKYQGKTTRLRME